MNGCRSVCVKALVELKSPFKGLQEAAEYPVAGATMGEGRVQMRRHPVCPTRAAVERASENVLRPRELVKAAKIVRVAARSANGAAKSSAITRRRHRRLSLPFSLSPSALAGRQRCEPFLRQTYDACAARCGYQP